MATRDDTDEVVEEDEEEQRGEEWEVHAPGVAEQALADVIPHELDDVLDGVHEESLRDEALRLLLLEDEEDNEQENDCDAHPEDVLREANRGVSDDSVGHEAVDELAHLVGQLGECIHFASFPSFTTAGAVLPRPPNVTTWRRICSQGEVERTDPLSC